MHRMHSSVDGQIYQSYDEYVVQNGVYEPVDYAGPSGAMMFQDFLVGSPQPVVPLGSPQPVVAPQVHEVFGSPRPGPVVVPHVHEVFGSPHLGPVAVPQAHEVFGLPHLRPGPVPAPNPMPHPPGQAQGQEIRGVGIKFGERMDSASGRMMVYVKRIMSSSPAHSHKGITPGDLLLLLDGENVQGQGLDSLRYKIPGPAGTWVKLTFRSQDGMVYDASLCRTAYGDEKATNQPQALQQVQAQRHAPVQQQSSAGAAYAPLKGFVARPVPQPHDQSPKKQGPKLIRGGSAFGMQELSGVIQGLEQPQPLHPLPNQFPLPFHAMPQQRPPHTQPQWPDPACQQMAQPHQVPRNHVHPCQHLKSPPLSPQDPSNSHAFPQQQQQQQVPYPQFTSPPPQMPPPPQVPQNFKSPPPQMPPNFKSPPPQMPQQLYSTPLHEQVSQWQPQQHMPLPPQVPQQMYSTPLQEQTPLRQPQQQQNMNYAPNLNAPMLHQHQPLPQRHLLPDSSQQLPYPIQHLTPLPPQMPPIPASHNVQGLHPNLVARPHFPQFPPQAPDNMKRQEFPPQEQGLPQMPHQMLSKHPQKPQPMPQAARPPSNAQMAGHPQQAQFAGANFPLSNSAVHQHLQLQVPQMSTPQELKKKGRIARQGVLGQDAVISTNAFEDMGYTMETGFGNSVDRKFASFSSMGSNHGRDSLTSQSLAQPMKPHAGPPMYNSGPRIHNSGSALYSTDRTEQTIVAGASGMSQWSSDFDELQGTQV